MKPRRPQAFDKQVKRQVRRRILSGKRPDTFWRGLGAMGMVGWSVAIPLLAGTLLGQWLDAREPSQRSWTLILMLAGLVVGCWNAATWLWRERWGAEEESGDG